MKAKPPLEAVVQRQCLEWLNLQPETLARRINAMGVPKSHGGGFRKPGRFSGAGVSDCLGLRRGYFFAIEFKREGQKATPVQAAFLESVRAAGGVALVIHSLDELIGAFKELGWTS